MRVYKQDLDRVATILPGQGYTPHMPLLHFARLVLWSRGWTVREIWWDELPDADNLSVVDVAQRVLSDDENATMQLLVGKSLGTKAVPLAAEQRIPGIWLTPLLRTPEIARAASSLKVPSLLIGGTSDECWDSGYTGGRDVEVVEIDGADHSLELPGDPAGSVGVLAQVVERMQGFVDALPDGISRAQ